MSDIATDSDAEGYRPGVGVMLLDRTARIFVARRIDMPGENWQMPQGGIDVGETPRQAALRELREEIGTDKAAFLGETAGWLRYDLPQEISGRIWRGRFRGQIQKWFAMRFEGDDRDIDLNTSHPEFNAWKWVDAAELPALIVPFRRQLYIDVAAELGKFLVR